MKAGDNDLAGRGGLSPQHVGWCRQASLTLTENNLSRSTRNLAGCFLLFKFLELLLPFNPPFALWEADTKAQGQESLCVEQGAKWLRQQGHQECLW